MMAQLAQETAQVFVLVVTLMTGGGDVIGSKALPWEFGTLQACQDDLPRKWEIVKTEFPQSSQSYRIACRPKK